LAQGPWRPAHLKHCQGVAMELLKLLVAAVIIPSIEAQQEEEPWWAAVSAYHFPHIFATDLEDFLPQLRNSSEEFVLIDFYAPWCPHCQHFAPDFERLALATQRFDAAEAKVAKKPSILSATVDCVRFYDTCRFWGIDSYPTIKWGKREKWIEKAQRQQDAETAGADGSDTSDGAAAVQAALEPSDIETIEMDGTAESVVNWINNRTKYGLNISSISKKEVVKLLHQGETSTVKVGAASQESSSLSTADVWDAQLASALLLHDILQHHAFEDEAEETHQRAHSHKKKKGGARRRHVKPQAKSRNTTRSAFVDFVGLLSNRFPSSAKEGTSCRDSLMELNTQLRNNWAGMTNEVTTLESMKSHKKLVMIDPDWLEGQWKMCGFEWSKFKEGWHQCKGTWPGKRGFTCGLWSTFHFLAAQSTDESALSDLQTVRSTVAHFFDCEECRNHFLQVPAPEAGPWAKRDAQLWWWNAHNVVNRRVGKLEEMYDDGDPGYVKAQWPTEAECPKCRRPAHSTRHLRVRGAAAGTVTALGTVSTAPSAAALEGSKGDVPVESVTLVESVAREHWDLDEVVAFLDRHYGARPMF